MNAFATDVYRAEGSLRGGSVQFLDALVGEAPSREADKGVVPHPMLASALIHHFLPDLTTP